MDKTNNELLTYDTLLEQQEDKLDKGHDEFVEAAVKVEPRVYHYENGSEGLKWGKEDGVTVLVDKWGNVYDGSLEPDGTFLTGGCLNWESIDLWVRAENGSLLGFIVLHPRRVTL